MQHNNSHKKESFKLLQLSDDSKSLSDLELPHVSTVRDGISFTILLAIIVVGHANLHCKRYVLLPCKVYPLLSRHQIIVIL